MKNQEERVHTEIEMPIYSSAELDDFGKFLDKFRHEIISTDRKTKEQKTYYPIDMQEAQVAFGALKKRDWLGVPTYSVILKLTNTDGYGHVKGYERPTMMDLFYHKYEAWARRNYAVQAQNEAYVKIAEEQPLDISDVVAEKTV